MTVKILDSTLRDGKFEINPSLETKVNLMNSLCDSGISHIEAGENIQPGKYSNDQLEELRSLSKIAIKKGASLGCIVLGFDADVRDLEIIKDFNLDFIRVGILPNYINEGIRYIESAAKENFSNIFIQIIQSHVYLDKARENNCQNLDEIIKISNDTGVNCIYIVDSFSQMFPKDISLLYNYIKARSKIPIGLHAHNDNQMALTNSYEFFKLGGRHIDTTVAGIGRGRGNLPLFELLSLLENLGFYDNPNIHKILSSSRELIKEQSLREKYNDLDSYVCARYVTFPNDLKKILVSMNDSWPKVYQNLESSRHKDKSHMTDND